MRSGQGPASLSRQDLDFSPQGMDLSLYLGGDWASTSCLSNVSLIALGM